MTTASICENRSRAARFEREALPLRDELGRAARRYTGNAHDSEDLVQATYVKAWTAFDSFDAGTNLRAWMFRIMVNTWISAHRASQRRPRESLTDTFTDAQFAADARRFTSLTSAEAQALQLLPDEDIRHAIQALPDSLRSTIYYVDVCQYSYRETAQILRIPVGTVMSRIHRARRQLRVSLAQIAEKRGYTARYSHDVAA